MNPKKYKILTFYEYFGITIDNFGKNISLSNKTIIKKRIKLGRQRKGSLAHPKVWGTEVRLPCSGKVRGTEERVPWSAKI